MALENRLVAEVKPGMFSYPEIPFWYLTRQLYNSDSFGIYIPKSAKIGQKFTKALTEFFREKEYHLNEAQELVRPLVGGNILLRADHAYDKKVQRHEAGHRQWDNLSADDQRSLLRGRKAVIKAVSPFPKGKEASFRRLFDQHEFFASCVEGNPSYHDALKIMSRADPEAYTAFRSYRSGALATLGARK